MMKALLLAAFLLVGTASQPPRKVVELAPGIKVFVGPGKDLKVSICVDRDSLTEILVVLLSKDDPKLTQELKDILKTSGDLTIVMSNKLEP